MAGCAFEPVRDMPVVSDYHQVEVDQFQAPAPPSIGLLHDRVGTHDWGGCVCVGGAARAWTLPSNRSAYPYSLHIHFVHFKEIA